MDFDFKRDVVDKSFEVPVLIDFWASWCGPCKILGPILEQLETESNGKWALVKIDTEKEPQIASYFKIQSIPNCKLVYEGKIIDEFSGAQSKAVIKKWMEEHLSKILPEEVEAEEEIDDFDSILDRSTLFPDKELIKSIEQFLLSYPDHQKAIQYLAQHLIFYNPDEAIQLLDKIPSSNETSDWVFDFQVIKTWMKSTFTDKNPAAPELLQAKESFLNAKAEQGIEHIINAVHKDQKYADELPRKLGIAIFHILGQRHNLTKEYRKLFDMAVY